MACSFTIMFKILSFPSTDRDADAILYYFVESLVIFLQTYRSSVNAKSIQLKRKKVPQTSQDMQGPESSVPASPWDLIYYHSFPSCIHTSLPGCLMSWGSSSSLQQVFSFCTLCSLFCLPEPHLAFSLYL